MGMLSDFFLADKATIPEYSGMDVVPEDRCQFKGITPLEAAGILSVLRGGGDRMEMLDDFPLLTPQEAEEWTMSVPQDMVATLAELGDSQLLEVGRQCAQVTAEELGWSAEDFQAVISQLRGLARRATDTNRSMYLWIGL